MTSDLPTQMRGLVAAFEIALPDVEAGRYGPADFERLASYCDNLCCAMRREGAAPRVVIEGTVIDS